ncbi:hypothetical protein ABZX56_30445 [Streptomyces parvulus]|uniref:hypothetical protein n=1 Tax=Streptomyces TaxID=1883 RepID=UPI0033A136B6
MTDWRVEVPERLFEEFAHLSPGGRRAVHDVLERLTVDPRDPGSTSEPIQGAELRRIMTEPAADSGDRITVLYRITEPESPTQQGRITILYIISGP